MSEIVLRNKHRTFSKKKVNTYVTSWKNTFPPHY